MATKSEQFHAEQERTAAKKATVARAKPDATTNESDRAGKKATYAFEEAEGRPSRKSSRKAANHAKPDTGLTLREQLVKNTPKERHTRDGKGR